MSLVPHKITALAESDAQGTSGKNIVAGAVVSLYDNSGAAVTLFDNEAGANGSTTKQTDATGQVVVYVNPGEYDEEVNGGTRRRIVVSDNGLRSQLADVNSTVLVGGFDAKGVGSLRSQLAATNSTVLVGGTEAGKLAKSTTLITPAEWGILADGSDETSKWQSLIVYCATNELAVGAFQGETLITSQLLLPSGFGGIYGDSQLRMVFKKGFNGDLFSLNSQGMVLENFWIQGEGGTFSGGGVYVVSDNINLDHVRITDTQDSPVICKANDSTFFNIVDSHLSATDNVNVAAIRSDGIDASPAPTVRKFDKISGAFKILDASGMNEFTLCNSLFSDVTFDANCSKGKFFGNRVTAASNDIIVDGDNHVFQGNIVSMGAAQDFILNGSGSVFDDSNIYIKGTNQKASILNNAVYGGALTHSISSKLIDFSSDLVLKGSTSDWTAGNSAVSAFARLSDQSCYYTFQITRGSTATNPSGNFSVTLPFKALVGSQGSVLIKSSTGTYYTGILQVFGGGNSASLWINTSTEQLNDASIAFGTNATIQGAMQYLVAAS